LSLASRNQIDPQAVETAGATKSTLLDGVEAVKTSESAKPTAQPVRDVVRSPRAKKTATPPKADEVVVRPASCSGVINGLRNAQECY
jgi:hypothetical protein